MYRIEVYNPGTKMWVKSNRCADSTSLEIALEQIATRGDGGQKYRVLDEKNTTMWMGRTGLAIAQTPEKAENPYRVELQDGKTSGNHGIGGAVRFASSGDAIRAIAEHGSVSSGGINFLYRVVGPRADSFWCGTVKEAKARWKELAESTTTTNVSEWSIMTATVTSTEGNEMHNEPLTVPVAKVIEQLETALEVIQMERNELEAKAQESREELYRALHDLSNDQLAKLVEGRWGEGSTKAAKNVEQMKDDGQLEYPESKPTAKETDLERFLRVLRISSDKTVNVVPDGPLYQLL